MLMMLKKLKPSLKSLNSQETPGSGGIPQIWGNLKNQIQGNPPDMGFERERTIIMSYIYSWTLLDYSGKC